jgi:hypothetical protein
VKVGEIGPIDGGPTIRVLPELVGELATFLGLPLKSSPGGPIQLYRAGHESRKRGTTAEGNYRTRRRIVSREHGRFVAIRHVDWHVLL